MPIPSASSERVEQWLQSLQQRLVWNERLRWACWAVASSAAVWAAYTWLAGGAHPLWFALVVVVISLLATLAAALRRRYTWPLGKVAAWADRQLDAQEALLTFVALRARGLRPRFFPALSSRLLLRVARTSPATLAPFHWRANTALVAAGLLLALLARYTAEPPQPQSETREASRAGAMTAVRTGTEVGESHGSDSSLDGATTGAVALNDTGGLATARNKARAGEGEPIRVGEGAGESIAPGKPDRDGRAASPGERTGQRTGPDRGTGALEGSDTGRGSTADRGSGRDRSERNERATGAGSRGSESAAPSEAQTATRPRSEAMEALARQERQPPQQQPPRSGEEESASEAKPRGAGRGADHSGGVGERGSRDVPFGSSQAGSGTASGGLYGAAEEGGLGAMKTAAPLVITLSGLQYTTAALSDSHSAAREERPAEPPPHFSSSKSGALWKNEVPSEYRDVLRTLYERKERP